ncbi:hypothetical protein SAMN05443144_1042 [Fodinibius roseus]|uniref:Uncharacterized protein n=1 Tax=Fodinibius roseus TaxID=1194090 RepID=A0A1M4X2D9_9BACT|nr:hypothetical protein [Fodinibius roseus]SHE87649.1 hypothetical protein SAMN05443144_1042 [Fodinibius roseus]
MSQLKKTYEKYRDEFEKLEKHCSAFTSAANPFEYEQWAKTGGAYDRYGNDMMSSEVPDSIKEDHRLYWEQRDKIDAILRKDEKFQKLVASKNYETGGTGLEAFFWISLYVIKHKVGV